MKTEAAIVIAERGTTIVLTRIEIGRSRSTTKMRSTMDVEMEIIFIITDNGSCLMSRLIIYQSLLIEVFADYNEGSIIAVLDGPDNCTTTGAPLLPSNTS
jgi:hypothetical protein